ncbi:hypothetical protein VS883_27535, partial [Escherichia coli]
EGFGDFQGFGCQRQYLFPRSELRAYTAVFNLAERWSALIQNHPGERDGETELHNVKHPYAQGPAAICSFSFTLKRKASATFRDSAASVNIFFHAASYAHTRLFLTWR